LNDRPAIVFVHGLLGFSCLRLASRPIICCFRGVSERLEKTGLRALFPAVPRRGSVEERAEALARYVSGIDCDTVHIVAHSMGGLDARFLIHRLDPNRRVRSLITVGTPHHGSPLAEWVLEERTVLARLLRRLTLPGVRDLTPEACARFNETTPDRPDVRYRSFAGSRSAGEMPPWFRPWTRMLEARAGPNDSQVPVASARWGEFRGIIRADHLELVGWSLGPADARTARPFDHLGLYSAIAASLAPPGD